MHLMVIKGWVSEKVKGLGVRKIYLRGLISNNALRSNNALIT